MVESQRTHFEIAVQNDVEESFLFIVISVLVRDGLILHNYDFLWLDLLGDQVENNFLQQLAELFVASVRVCLVQVGIVQVLDGQVSQALSELLAHAKSESDHAGRFVKCLFEVKSVEHKVLGGWHAFSE